MAVDPLDNIEEEFSEPVEGFIAWLELERGLSNNTRMAYARDLAQAASFFKDQGFPDWGSIDPAATSAYAEAMGKKICPFQSGEETIRSAYARSSSCT